MATARGPRGAPDSGRPDHERPRATARPRGPWPLARMPGSSCRAAGMPMRRAGGGAARCGMRGVPAARRWPRLYHYHVTINHSFPRESRTHDVLRARPDTEPPAAGNRGLLVSPLVAPRVTEVRAMSRHIPHTTMSKFTLCLRALPVILIFLVLVRARCHGVASRCEHRRKLLREARGVSSGRR